MFNTNMNVRYAVNKCTRFIRAWLWRSREVDFTVQTTEAEMALAYGLWDYYNLNLPDTPRRVAMVVSHILNEKGYSIYETR